MELAGLEPATSWVRCGREPLRPVASSRNQAVSSGCRAARIASGCACWLPHWIVPPLPGLFRAAPLSPVAGRPARRLLSAYSLSQDRSTTPAFIRADTLRRRKHRYDFAFALRGVARGGPPLARACEWASGTRAAVWLGSVRPRPSCSWGRWRVSPPLCGSGEIGFRLTPVTVLELRA
jgi:hypothetical protein